MQALQNTTPRELSDAGLNESYQNDIRVFNRWAQGRAITPALIKDFFEDMRKLKSPDTLNHYKSAIKKALLNSFGPEITLSQQAQIKEFFSDIKTGRRDPSISAERCLDREGLRGLKISAGPKTRLIIQALYETAARVSELINIRLNDCTLQGAGVLVKIRHGKGDKQRTVFISIELYNEIRAAWSGSEYLFEHKGKHISRGTVATLLKRAGKHVDRHTTPHVLRHSWASLSIKELGLSAVSQYLGHASPSTTAAYYLHGRAPMGDVLAVNQLNAGV